MRNVFLLSTLLTCFSHVSLAATPSLVTALDDFAQLPAIQHPALSPDGHYLATQCSNGRRFEICIADLTDKQPTIHFGTGDEAQIKHVSWGSNKHVLVYIQQTRDVALRFQTIEVEYDRIYAFNVEQQTGVVLMNGIGGSIRNLTHVVALLPDQESVLMQILLADDNDKLDYRATIYQVDLNDGRSERIKQGALSVRNFVYDAEGKLLAETKLLERHNSFTLDSYLPEKHTIYKQDTAIVPFSVMGMVDSGKIAVQFDDQRGAMSLSLADGQLDPLTFQGEIVGQTGSAITDDYRNTLLGFEFWDGVLPDQMFTHGRFAGLKKALAQAMPDKKVLIVSWTRDLKTFLLKATEAGKPDDFYTFSLNTGMMDALGTSSTLPAEHVFSQVMPIEYQANDGLKIHGFVTLPPGKTVKQGPFPMILMPHGGPESHDDASYDWMAQYYASLGYAVLQPNFRGSSGYGVEFRNKGFGEYGGKMVTDVIDGYHNMVKKGIAAKNGFCAIGWSYGGYSALQMAVKSADLIKCAISVNGVTDPVHQKKYRSQVGSQQWYYYDQYLGLENNQGKIRSYTPLENVEQIKAPVLLLHGNQDSTVPFIQAEKFRDAMQTYNKVPFRFVEVDAQDHYFQDVAARKTVLTETTEWLKMYFPLKTTQSKSEKPE
ncbi:alpha/beta hydrolase family protein [Neptunicella sp. SCSIO 80796]|uniref:alpha/beta hydrolase family protein n=1 Tax=Neptunicella plasticusilytica TaxID=3117012 RepID=UPI003A4D49CA